MAITITTLAALAALGTVIAPRRLFYDADKTRLVIEGHPDAAFLAASEGGELHKSVVTDFGLEIAPGEISNTGVIVWPEDTEEVHKVESEAGTITVEEPEDESEQLRTTVEQLRNEIEGLTEELTTLQADLANTTRERDALKKDAVKLGTDIQKLLAKNKALEVAVAKLTKTDVPTSVPTAEATEGATNE